MEVGIDAQDERGISSVQFMLDGSNLGNEDTEAPYTINLDTTTITNGDHTLSAVATNIVGLTTAIEQQVTIYNLPPPPSVRIISPSDNSTVSGTVPIEMTAQDSEGVALVQLKLDDTVLVEDTTELFNYSWDTKTATNGNHVLSATAVSVNGQTTTTAITVNVQNITQQPEPLIIRIIKIINSILNWFKRLF